MSRERRILFIQYANPAAYPPLLHGTRILAREGWQVRVLGVETPGTLPLEWPRTEGVDCRVMRGTPVGLLLKLQYLIYTVVLHRYLRWRLPGYTPAEHLGGVVYLYVRGMCGPETPVVDGHPAGVFSWALPPELVVALSDLLDRNPLEVSV